MYKGRRQSEINEELLRQQGNLINYSYGEIKKMTNNFKAKLGEGPHGTVFRGNLRSGICAAVKMLMNSSSTDKEFISYVSRMSRISHPNVAKLIGFCIKGTKRALVYESVEAQKPHLSYGEMFKICVGIACGIECLHSNEIFHLGIKPENILLDEDLNAKISDSGVSRHYSSGVQKMGFIPPELWYKNVGEISSKADVYSYGMVVLEMGAKLESLNKGGGVYFPRWIYNQLSEGKELEMEEEEKEIVKKMMVVALWCIQIRAGDRPSMSEVVGMLQGRTDLLPIPPMPFQKATMDDHILS